jgi:broad specificity phosphatase PhoE
MKQPASRVTRIVLVRHGETEWNVVERFRGRVDVPLNETGRAQAQAVARRLRAWPVEAVYSSPLSRALDTAQPIAEACGRQLAVLDSLADVDYGEWAGLSIEEAQAHDAVLFATWHGRPHRARFPHGESLEQVRKRSRGAVEGVSARHVGKIVVLVSHVVVNRVIICNALGLTGDGFWRIGQDNASITVLDCADGRYRLTLLNDTCHLEDTAPEA